MGLLQLVSLETGFRPQRNSHQPFTVRSSIMGEYASKGVGAGALTTGIIGTSLAGLLTLNQGNGGLLGGLLGGNNNAQQEKITNLMNENTLLKGQAYTDSQVRDTNREICNLKTEVAVQGQKINCLETQMNLRGEITDGKIANAVLTTGNTITALQGALQCMQGKLNEITSTFVPAAHVTPLPAPNPFPPVPPYSPYPPYPFPPIVPPVVVPPTVQSGTTTTPEATNTGA
jgi:hypothetical protein